MKVHFTVLTALSLGFAPALATADGNQSFADDSGPKFRRISTFPVYLNNTDIATETVAEIVDATADGKTLVYSDGEQEAVGFIDITNPSQPTPLGNVPLTGEPTSVSVAGPYVLVGVNTSASLTQPSGHVAVVDIHSQTVVASIPLAGQPDSLKVSPNGRYCAVAIENERDEDIFVNGEEGGLPQLPAGLLQIIDIRRGTPPSKWGVRNVDLTGLAAYGGSDPEPEFVDVNRYNEAVVTLQENNHLVVVDLRTGRIRSSFGAGTVDLFGIDTTEDRIISLTESETGIPREPDAVTWLDRDTFATANEGDLFGGSRGFTIFDRWGGIRFDSGVALERLAVRYGHYLDDRSGNKGAEPEAIEFARFGPKGYIFVGTERSNFVAVYRYLGGPPEFVQVLPAGLGPEGLLAIPNRNLLVVSSEVDDPSFGVRASVQIYKLGRRATYPDIISANDAAGNPIAWSALSGMTALPHDERNVLAVWDSFFAQSTVFKMDVSRRPAVIKEAIAITGGTGNFDPEGIAVAPDGTYWIASEGNGSGSRRNRLLQINTHGQVLSEIGLPADIEACRAASTNRGSLGGGFEGLTVVPKNHGYVLYVAQQRGWDYTTTGCEALDDDPNGANGGEPRQTRIWKYDPAQGTWGSFAYELEPVPSVASWVGLSEITRTKNGDYVIIERDNRTGDFSNLKTLVLVDGHAFADGIITRAEKKVFDLEPRLKATNGWITDKPEGVAITDRGRVFVVTDNDGVDDWSGETWLLRLGRLNRLFR